MEFGFDPGSMLVGLAAFYIAWQESRRNSRAILKLTDFSSSTPVSVDENNGIPFVKLSAKIRSLGLPIHDVQAYLCYKHPEIGNVRLVLPPHVGDEYREIPRGAWAEFEFKSYKFERLKHFFRPIDDALEQQARIEILAQGNLVKEFRFYGPLERFKRQWNEIAWKIRPDSKWFRFSRFLAFECRSWKVEGFSRSLISNYQNPPTSFLGPNGRFQ